jgi:hypothetical protein
MAPDRLEGGAGTGGAQEEELTIISWNIGLNGLRALAGEPKPGRQHFVDNAMEKGWAGGAFDRCEALALTCTEGVTSLRCRIVI